MRIEAQVDRQSLKSAEDSLIRIVLLSEVEALHDATRFMEKDLERQTRAAAKGAAWRAWKSTVYPTAKRPAADPQGLIFSNGGHRSHGMLTYFSRPGVNRAKQGKYLAVPMNEARKHVLGRRALRGMRDGTGDILRFQLQTGIKLQPLFRPGKAPLLVAKGYRTAGGAMLQKSDRDAAAMRAGGQRLTPVTIPMFALIDAQPHANRVGIHAAGRRASDRFETVFSRRLRANMGRR